jgi:hypothetical protein
VLDPELEDAEILGKILELWNVTKAMNRVVEEACLARCGGAMSVREGGSEHCCC